MLVAHGNRMKQRIERTRLVALVLVVSIAVLATTATTVAELAPVLGRVLAAAAALGTAVLPTFAAGVERGAVTGLD